MPNSRSPRQFPMKFAVGTPTGVSSSTWTISPRMDDIYLWTWVSGGQHKVSLHASGDCHWSGTEKWVRENARPDFQNKERHFEKWHQAETDPSGLNVLCRLLFPTIDLGRSLKDVKISADKGILWLPPPGVGQATEVNCYIYPRDASPRDLPAIPGTILGEHQ